MLHSAHEEVKLQLAVRWPLLAGSIAFLGGVAAATALDLATYVPIAVATVVASLIGCGLARAFAQPGLLAGILLIGVGLVGAALVVASHRSFPLIAEGQTLTAHEVTVVSSPERLATGQRAYVDTVVDGQPLRLRATLRTQVPLEYGAQLLIDGQVEPPRRDPAWNEQGFLRAHRAHGRLIASSVEVLGTRQGHPVLMRLHDFRAWLLDRLKRSLAAPEVGLAAGVLLGDQGGLSERLEDAFRRTGTTHILVVSGSNVLIVAWIVQQLLVGAGRKLAGLGTVLTLLSFIVLSGADASVIRATVFYIFVLLAQLTGQRVHAPTLVAWVAALMALVNPWIILYDISFQLSFAAVLGLLTFAPWLARMFRTWWAEQFLAPTLAAQLGTLPVLIYHFGTTSVIAPLANLLIVPLIPIVMAGAAATLVVPWLPVVAWVTEGVATIVLWLVTTLSTVPFSQLNVEAHHAAWTLAAVGLVVGCLIIRLRMRVVGARRFG